MFSTIGSAGAAATKSYAITINVDSTLSGKHLCGLLLDVLSRRGHQVNRLHVRLHTELLAGYVRSVDGARD
jgi:hypothetical protein